MSLGAARPARAQAPVELRLVALGTATATRYAGGGVGASVGLGGRLRFEALTTLGDADGRLGTRNEAAVTFHLTPYRARGVAVYGGGGAALLTTGAGTSEYMVLFLGLEARPARAVGWFVEGGVGGGVRLAAGYRIRLGR
jgi:hypothetical protein